MSKHKYSKQVEAEMKRYQKQALKKCQKAGMAWLEAFMVLAGVDTKKKKWW